MKILLIEDDCHTSDLLSATLSAHRYAVDTVDDGSAGLALASQWSYDLILLDVLMPSLDGFEVCRQLRQRNCRTPILMLTTQASDKDVITGLDAGADDYVAKSCDHAQLLARMRALLRRQDGRLMPPVLRWGGLQLDPATAEVTYNQQVLSLRPKEYSLLELFLRQPQRVLSRSAIIDHLWSIDETPVEGSVTNLIKDLRQRLRAAGLSGNPIETVYGLGYRLRQCPKAIAAPAPEQAHRASRDRALLAIEQIAERFRVSLGQRLTVLEAAARSLAAEQFSLPQQQAATTEAHKLAGGLGTFGCTEASAIAQAIEQLLTGQISAPKQQAQLLEQKLDQLRRALTLTPTRWS